MTDWSSYSTSEIAAIFWDFFKDVHGVRPRWVDHTNREELLHGITMLQHHMQHMRSTPEGRASLKEQGWSVTEENLQ